MDDAVINEKARQAGIDAEKKRIATEAGAPPVSDAQKQFDEWNNSQSGYVGKTKKAEWWDNYNKQQESKGILNGYATNPQGGFNIYGNGDQQMQTASNLSQVGVMTGQNIFDAGNQQQEYYDSLQARRNGTDAAGVNLKNQANRSLANSSRAMAGRGVAGGVAGAGLNSAEQQSNASINDQMQKTGAANDKELWNYVKRNQKVTGEALAAGQDQGLASSMDTSAAEGAFGTVICTELHRQGLMDDDTYRKDVIYGKMMEKQYPRVIAGYRFLATPVAKKMKTSPLLTKCIAPFGLAWGRWMTGEPDVLGRIIWEIGFATCSLVGLFLPRKQVVA